MYFGINTISSKSKYTWKDMIGDGKNGSAFVYYKSSSTRTIRKLLSRSHCDVVYLYHSGTGFIAKGITDSRWEKTNADNNYVELRVSLRFVWALPYCSEWANKAPRANDINRRMNTKKKFRGRMFTVSEEVANVIDDIARQKHAFPAQAGAGSGAGVP